MSDVRTRTLERRWRETGTADDQAAWLRAREQSEELEAWKIDVGCSLGHPACLQLRGLPADHKETLVDVFDLLVTKAGAPVILYWLTCAMRIWKEILPAEVAPDLASTIDKLYTTFHSGRDGVDIWQELATAGASFRTASTTSIGLHILVELMQAVGAPDRPYQGTNPVAWASWLEQAVREPASIAVGGVALHVRHDLRQHCLPKLLGAV